MKTKSIPSLAVSRFHPQSDNLPVRVIKSKEAEAILQLLRKPEPTPTAPESASPVPEPTLIEIKPEPQPAKPKHAPEIHLLASGPDYCDLEVICSCGEVSKIRCWNSLSESQPKESAA